MPILIDIRDNKVLGREYRRGRADGVQEGRAEGIHAGELSMLRTLALARFGELPAAFEESLRGKSPEDLLLLGSRLLNARTLDELLN